MTAIPRTTRSRLPHSASLLLLLLLTACVPKAQYDTVVTQRDYYQQRALKTDSLAEARALTRSDSLGQQAYSGRQQLKEIEDLTATNLSLRESLTDVRNRYEILLEQNSELLTASGSDVMSLQQDLRDRTAALSKKEADLRRTELNLQAREQQLASLGGSPETYCTETNPQGTNPVDPRSNAAVDLGRLYDELGQLMLAVTDTGYVLSEPTGNRFELILDEKILFADSQSVSLDGQRLLRKLAATLRNYPKAKYTIIAHAESVDGNALLAYDSSMRRSVNVALQLSQFGLDAGRIVAGSMGFYGSQDARSSPTGQPGARRTEIVIAMEP